MQLSVKMLPSSERLDEKLSSTFGMIYVTDLHMP